MSMIDGALCVSLGLELQSAPEPKKTVNSVKMMPSVEKLEVSHDAALWKGLYYGLLDKLIRAKSVGIQRTHL